MEIFYTLVALVYIAAGPPIPIYDRANQYPTEVACLENARDFNTATRIMMRRLPVLSVEVWCRKQVIHENDEVT